MLLNNVREKKVRIFLTGGWGSNNKKLERKKKKKGTIRSKSGSSRTGEIRSVVPGWKKSALGPVLFSPSDLWNQ